MKQHSVPENIMDVEFKLFGSLSAKQFGYIIFGGCIGLFFFYFFKSLNSVFLGWIFAFLSVILGISLALIRINEQPFEVWLGNFIAAMFSSQKRVWRKDKKIPSVLDKKLEQAPQIARNTVPVVTEQTQPKPIISKGNVQEVSSGKMDQSTVTPTPQVSYNPNQSQLAGKQVQGDTQYVQGAAQKYITITSNQTPNRPVNLPNTNLQSNSNLNVPTQQNIGSGANTNVNTNIPQQPNISDIQPNNQTHINKANQYNDIVPDKSSTIQNINNGQTGGDLTQDSVSASSSNLQDENKALREKIAEFTEEKQKMQQELSSSKSTLKVMQDQNVQMLEQMKSIQVELKNLKEKRESQRSEENLKDKTLVSSPLSEDSGILSPKVYQGPSLSKKPNVISGIVKSKDGKLLPGVVIIVKNDKSRPVRAMKTNSLGQFVTTTALENGLYIIELSKNEYTFGRFEINLIGDALPTYEFTSD
jgi:hypothetical protein